MPCQEECKFHPQYIIQQTTEEPVTSETSEEPETTIEPETTKELETTEEPVTKSPMLLNFLHQHLKLQSEEHQVGHVNFNLDINIFVISEPKWLKFGLLVHF